MSAVEVYARYRARYRARYPECSCRICSTDGVREASQRAHARMIDSIIATMECLKTICRRVRFRLL